MHGKYKELRDRGLKVTYRWCKTRMYQLCVEHMPDGFDPKMKFGNKWVKGFKKRKRISFQKKTNTKSTSVWKKLHKILNYHFFWLIWCDPEKEYPQWNHRDGDFNAVGCRNLFDAMIEDSEGSEDYSSDPERDSLDNIPDEEWTLKKYFCDLCT